MSQFACRRIFAMILVLQVFALGWTSCAIAAGGCSHPIDAITTSVEVHGYYYEDEYCHRIGTWVTCRCRLCGQVLEEYGDGGETEAHVFDSTGTCIYCGYYDRNRSTQNNNSNNNRNWTNDQINDNGIAVPYQWDTQFKPGAAYNDRSIDILDRLYDGFPTPAFYYTNWRSQRTDSIPEFTAYFSGGILNGISIVNGNAMSPSEYQNKARMKDLRIDVHTDQGTYGNYLTLSDVFSSSAQYYDLDCYGNVYSVDIYVLEIYPGNRDKYEVNIGEIGFY